MNAFAFICILLFSLPPALNVCGGEQMETLVFGARASHFLLFFFVPLYNVACTN